MLKLLRKWVADAVVAGVGDGLERLGVRLAEPGPDEERAQQVERLLPAPKKIGGK